VIPAVGRADAETHALPPNLGRAIRGSFQAYLDDILLFFVVNVAVVTAFVLLAVARSVFPPLLILAPLLALPVAVLMRLAVATARDEAPTWRVAAGEFGRLGGRKLLLGAGQLALMAVGLTNLIVSDDIGGLAGVVSALVGVYAVVLTSLYAFALWPIVCDPRREASLRAQLRLAVVLLMTRPLQLGVLGLIAGLALVLSVQLIVPAVILPSLVLIMVAGYVVPAIDRLRASP
jgi:hypothetical protein